MQVKPPRSMCWHPPGGAQPFPASPAGGQHPFSCSPCSWELLEDGFVAVVFPGEAGSASLMVQVTSHPLGALGTASSPGGAPRGLRPQRKPHAQLRGDTSHQVPSPWPCFLGGSWPWRAHTAGGPQPSGQPARGGSGRYRLQEAGARSCAEPAPLGREEGKEGEKQISTIGKICSDSPAGALLPLLQEIRVRVLQRKTTRRNT